MDVHVFRLHNRCFQCLNISQIQVLYNYYLLFKSITCRYCCVLNGVSFVWQIFLYPVNRPHSIPIQMYKYTSTIPIQPPSLVNLPGAAVEAETVLAQRTVMSFTCTDTVDAPAARITVSPSTTPEFFRLQTTSSVARSSGNKVKQSCVLAKQTLSVVVRMRSFPKIRSFFVFHWIELNKCIRTVHNLLLPALSSVWARFLVYLPETIVPKLLRTPFKRWFI